jgi:site-specific DNA-methyltransferase (adenine-specific)
MKKISFKKLPINSVVCGNNVNVLETFPDESIDLIVTSPPYDGLRTYNGFVFDIYTLVPLLYKKMKVGGVIVWVVGDETKEGTESGTSFVQALLFKEHGFNIHDTMIYGKNGFANPSTNRYHQVFEYAFVFSKGEPKSFNPIKDRLNKSEGEFKRGKARNKEGVMVERKGIRKQEKFGMRTNIWMYNVGGSVAEEDYAFEHPAIFPEQLAEDHILSWSKPNDLVVDIFSGSGTTIKMAKLNERKYIGIDISSEYCGISEKRVSEANPESYKKKNLRQIHKHTKKLMDC